MGCQVVNIYGVHKRMKILFRVQSDIFWHHNPLVMVVVLFQFGSALSRWGPLKCGLPLRRDSMQILFRGSVFIVSNINNFQIKCNLPWVCFHVLSSCSVNLVKCIVMLLKSTCFFPWQMLPGMLRFCRHPPAQLPLSLGSHAGLEAGPATGLHSHSLAWVGVGIKHRHLQVWDQRSVSNQCPLGSPCHHKDTRNLKVWVLKQSCAEGRKKNVAPGSCTRGTCFSKWVHSGSRAAFAEMQDAVLSWASGGTVFCLVLGKLCLATHWHSSRSAQPSANSRSSCEGSLGDDVIAGIMLKCLALQAFSAAWAAQPCILMWVKWYCFKGSWVNEACSCGNKGRWQKTP